MECQYYLYLLARQRDEEGDSDDVLAGDVVRIALERLLVFPKVKALCESMEDIRYVSLPLQTLTRCDLCY